MIRLPRLRLPWARDARGPGTEAPAQHAGSIAPAPDMAEPSRVSQTFRAFRHRNYRLFYTGQAISLSGTWMRTIAQSWLVLQITDSKEALGLVTMLQFLPITLFVLFAGVIADRVPKRDLIMATRLLAMCQSLLLAVLVTTGQIELWHVYILAAILGFANAFEQPTRQAFVVEMVGKDDILNAVALNSGLFNGARLVGPAIGGVVIAAAGVEAAFFINFVSFVPTIAALLMMDMSQLYKSDTKPGPGTGAISELREGISFALRTPATLLMVILALFIGMFGFNFIVVLPLVAKYVLDGGSAQLGFLTAALGAGAVMSALVLAGRKTVSHFTVFVGGSMFAVLLAAVAASHWFALTLLALVLLGVALTAFAATANTALQLATPDHLRGRVMGLWMLLFAGSTPFGGYSRVLAEHIGVQEAIGFNAGMCAIGVAVALLYYASHHRDIVRTADASRLTLAADAA
jgi:MFS family permease